MKYLFLVALGSLLLSAMTVVGQQSSKSHQIDSLRTVIARTKGDVNAINAYVKLLDINSDTLDRDMTKWMKQYPVAVSFPKIYGMNLQKIKSPKALNYLTKAAELDPEDVEILAALAIEANFQGNFVLANSYYGKAAALKPDDVDVQASYASSYKNIDHKLYVQKVNDVVDRFKNEERATALLSSFGYAAVDPNEKIATYERLRTLFDPQKNIYAAVAMFRLADLYVQKGEIDKVIPLVDSLKDVPRYSYLQFAKRHKLATDLLTVRELAKAKKFDEAITMSNNIEIPSNFLGRNTVELIKADIYASADKVQDAYDSLLLVQTIRPDDMIWDALSRYGKQLGKDHASVSNDVNRLRSDRAEVAPTFALGTYDGKPDFDLAKYKGKVVLMSYWYPGCGPCRAEMPHLENALRKVDRSDIVYIGINSVRSQDNYVADFVKNANVTFTPLKGTKEVISAYKVVVNPMNFIIDKEGKIAYSNFMINGDNERMLELMLESLIK